MSSCTLCFPDCKEPTLGKMPRFLTCSMSMQHQAHLDACQKKSWLISSEGDGLLVCIHDDATSTCRVRVTTTTRAQYIKSARQDESWVITERLMRSHDALKCIRFFVFTQILDFSYFSRFICQPLVVKWECRPILKFVLKLCRVFNTSVSREIFPKISNFVMLKELEVCR